MRDARAIAWVMSAVVFVPATLQAQQGEDPERATQLYQEGIEHYRVGEYREALRAFEQANQAYEDATLLYNAARSAEQLGESERALELVEQALANQARPLPDKLRTPALEMRARLKKAAAQEPPAPPEKQPKERSDGSPSSSALPFQPSEQKPPEDGASQNPDKREPAPTADGTPDASRVPPASPGGPRVESSSTSGDTGVSRPLDRAGSSSRALSGVGMGMFLGGGGLVATSLVLGGRVQEGAQQMQEADSQAEYDSLRQSVETQQRNAQWLFFGGVGLGVAGAGLWWWGRRRRETSQARNWEVSPEVLGRAGATFTWSF